MALAVVSLSLITVLHFELQVEKWMLLFIFFGTVTAYNFVKYAGITGLHHRSLAQSLKIIQVFSFFCLAGVGISAFYVAPGVLLWSAIFGALTLLYALPVFNKKRNLRSVSGLKIFIIAFVWAGVTVVLPVTGAKNVIFEALVLEFLQRILLVLAWILPFEIRDLKYDLEQLGTIPQRIGLTKTKILGLFFLLLVLFLEVLKNSGSTASTIAVIIMCIISGIFLAITREKQSRYFTAFWVEAIPILWLLILIFLRIL